MPFPSDSQFTPVTVGNQPVFDLVGDESPGSTDLVGNASFPSFYYAYDGTNVYFRLRLNEDPRNSAKTAFRNFSWGVLFNTNGVAGTYQWLLSVNGNAARLDLIQNTIQEFNSWNDPAEGTNGQGAPNFSRPIINFDVARVTLADSTFGGNPDFFLDFFIPASTLFSFLGITESTPLKLISVTSTNANNYNKDSLRSAEGFQFINALSDPQPVVAVDVKAKLAISKTLVSGPSTVTAGVSNTYTARITVQNTGKSQATTVFVRDVIGLDVVSDFSVVTIGTGNAAYDSLTKTLSWNIGNLPAGATTTLLFTVTGTFVTSGSRTLETATVNGIDSFTGNQIPLDTAVTLITVQATGGVVGNVTDRSSGLPLSGVSVLLQQGMTTIGATTTNGSGSYSFTGVVPGLYTLTYSKTNYVSVSNPVTVTSQTITRADVLLTPQPGTITGTVSAQGGGAISNAQVTLVGQSGAFIAQTTTNGSGQYTLTNVAPGHYNVAVTATNFQSTSIGVDVAPNEIKLANFILQPNPATIQGTVTNLIGDPLSGALVEVLSGAGVIISTTTTNGAGQYSLNQFAPGTYRVRVSAPLYTTQVIGTTLLAGATETINVVLSPNPGVLIGVVADANNGAPLANASVRVSNSQGVFIASTMTDNTGHYAVNSLASGSYSITFSADSYGSLILGAIIQSDATTVIDANLSRLVGTVMGTVTDSNGLLISGASVRLFQNNIVIASVLTDENGHYSINNLIPSTYTMNTSAPNFSTSVVGVTIQENQITTVNTQLQPDPGILSGSVTDTNGNLLSGATIVVRDSTSTTIVARTVTNPNGGYIVTELAPGGYTVTASSENFQTTISGVMIQSNQTATVNFSLLPNPATIMGTILDSTTNQPISGASIEVRIVGLNGAVVAIAFTDTTGNYVVNNLAPGTYGVIVSAPNYQLNSASVTLSPGQIENVSISLNTSPGSILGTITDVQMGTTIGGAVVKVTDANGFFIQSVLTDSQGNYSVTGIAPGSYNVIASANGYQTGLTGAVVQANTSTIRNIALLGDPGSIAGTVSPAMAGASVQLFSADNIFISSTITTPEGLFQFNNLTPGQYIITASAQNFGTSISGATVQSNQITSVAMTLQPNPASIAGQITSSTGGPVKDAVITILDSNESIIGIGSADVNGNYAIGNLPPGTFSIVVSAPNFSTVTSGITLNPGDSVNGIDFQMQPDPGNITGQVTDQNGNPISGAVIIVRTSQGAFVTSLLTSPFGNYIVQGLAPGSYTVIANKDQFSTESIGAIVISDQSTAANLTLTSLVGDISGSVVDQNGNPITGNNIQVKLLDQSGLLLRAFVAEPGGTFSVLGLSAGQYFLNVTAPGFSANTAPVSISVGTVTPVTIPLAPAPATLTGSVLNQITGDGIPGAIITISSPTGIFIAQGVSGDNGVFTITDLPPTTVVASANANSFGSNTMTVQLNPNQTSTILFRLSPNPGSLSGFIINAQTGEPIQGTVITIFNATTGEFVNNIVSDQFGQFLMEGLEPGSYRGMASAGGFSSGIANFVIESGKTTVLSFALTPNPATLRGTVTDAQTGDPITEAGIITVIQGSDIIVAATETDSGGNYVLTGISPGSYDVVFSAENYASQSVSVNLTAEETEIINTALIPNPATISGTVRDANTGIVLVNTLIQVFDGQGRFLASALTNTSGQYTIANLPGGTVTVNANAQNFTSDMKIIRLNPAGMEVVNFALTPNPASLRGKVTDAQTGAPLVGVLVQVFIAGTDVPVKTTLTDPSGLYGITGLAEGEYRVEISADNYATSIFRIVLGPGEERILDVALQANPATIQGTVTDVQTGEPIPGAGVVTVIEGSGIIVASTQTDQDGNYRLTGIAPGIYNVVFSADNFTSQTVLVMLSAGETEIVNPALTPNPANINGTVRDATTGNILSNALVQVFNSQGSFLASTLTDTSGQYTISGLPEGMFSVKASATNFAIDLKVITLSPGETEIVDFALVGNPASLSGIVTDAQIGFPLVGSLVQVFVVGTSVPVKSTLTDPDGRYMIPGLAEGEYRVVLSADNYASAIFRLVLGPGEERILDVALQANPATIQGTVTDAQTGDPITGAGVVTVIAGSGIIVASTQTDQNGNYVLTGIAPGSYNVVFSAENFTSQTVLVMVSAGETEIVNPALTPNPASINGTVRDAMTGNILSNALIQVFNSQGSFLSSTLTDTNGRYTISGLPEGTITVRASAVNFATELKVITLSPGETETVDFALVGNPASLTGRVTDAQIGVPLVGSLVQVFIVGTSVPVKSTLTDQNSLYVITGLAEGEYRVVISVENYASAVFHIVLGPGEERVLDAALQGNPATIQGHVTDAQTGDPITGAGVVTVIAGSGIIVASTQTDQNGNYVLTGIAPGSYNVVFSADNFTSQTVLVMVSAGETEIVNAALVANPASINGTIRDATTGEILSNALIQVFNSQGSFLASTLTDTNGRYTISGLPEGMITVRASAVNFATELKVITLSPGETETVDFALAGNPASLTGIVTDARTGDPLVGSLVQVFVVGTNVPVKSTLTDQNGLYVITGLAEGEYRVVFSADNYVSSIFRLVLGPGEERILDVALQANPATIQGHVTDAQTGEPISGAGVITVIEGSGIIVASTQTDQNGNYVLTGIAPGSYNVIFSAANFISQTVLVTVSAGETEIVNAALTPNPASITGTVRDATTGNILSNALIQVFNSQGSFLASTLTDTNGRYTISGLPEGVLAVIASADHFATDQKVITLSPGETEIVDFALVGNPASLTGRVTDARTGAPLDGSLVQVFIVGTSVPVKSTLTDQNGLYVITGLAEGEYRVVISADNYASAIFRIVLGPGEERILDVALQGNPATIQGTVTDAQTGDPIAGAGVVTVIEGSGIIVASTQTDQNGNYVLTGIAPGSYNVIFSAANFISQTVLVTVSAGETEIVNAALTPNPASINGTVRDATTGNILSNALIQVFNNQGSFLASTLTDINGRYTISGLPEGVLTVIASADHFATDQKVITLSPGETEIVDFSLVGNPASLTGIVTDANTGAPIARALVQVFVVGTNIPVKSTLTDPSGLYVITGLAEGEYRVVISADNYALAVFFISLSQGEVRILNAELNRNSASLHGRVTDAQTGKPIQHASIQMIDQISGTIIASTTTDFAGNYLISNLPEGTYRIIVTADGFQQRDITIHLEMNENRELNIQLMPMNLCIQGNMTKVECIFVNENGVPVGEEQNYGISLLTVKRMKEQEVVLPDGTLVELTLINALISGNIRILVYTSEGVCQSTIIPFRKWEKFLICTNDLSSISLNMLRAECNASIICRDGQLDQIDVDINLCAIINSLSSVILEVQGRVCKPRNDKLDWHQGNDAANDQPNENIDSHCIKIEQVNDSIAFSTNIQMELSSSAVRFNCRSRS